ncbi:MAG: HTH domain-containing protein [Rhodobacterales bacterium]|nr:HTH domain-containing protein [Rhodobacterales bacterium]
MKRDARLYDIVQFLRDGRLHTAWELTERLGVSTRTIWRDREMLAATGLPVTGERGLGYILRSPLMLPPTMLTPEELEALVEGLRHVGQDGNPRARSARSLLYKVATLLPQSGIEAEPRDT